MRWGGVTPQQYDEVRDRVRWEENTPDGARLHVCSFEGGALWVTDVWNSQAGFERFFNDWLAAAVKEAGIEGEPQTSFPPLHRRFIAPGVTGAASARSLGHRHAPRVHHRAGIDDKVAVDCTDRNAGGLQGERDRPHRLCPLPRRGKVRVVGLDQAPDLQQRLPGLRRLSRPRLGVLFGWLVCGARGKTAGVGRFPLRVLTASGGRAR
jgi:hypothetical protein